MTENINDTFMLVFFLRRSVVLRDDYIELAKTDPFLKGLTLTIAAVGRYGNRRYF